LKSSQAADREGAGRVVYRRRLDRRHRPRRRTLTRPFSAVRFTPSARTAWHSHAVGQTLHVTEGQGLVQSRGGDITEIRAGDVIWSPAGEWHWHGAAPDHFMTHLSITEAVPVAERPEADWRQHVTDDEYDNRADVPVLGGYLEPFSSSDSTGLKDGGRLWPVARRTRDSSGACAGCART
jgi:quercetin dioxygenase-like cupin family protein